ncbi:MAG TPA: J domain-containing protein [Vicinamibacterales bacterium]|nr:J domain-containing protein [Vicinamibacterales bacterium]
MTIMDFYSILGIDRTASAAEIKRAYRRLARRYHPGINPGDRAAEARFAQIAAAYETLVDPDKRREYDGADAGGPMRQTETRAFEFTEFDFSVAATGAQAATFTELFADVLHPMPALDPRPEPGADLHASLSLSFVDAMRGVECRVVITRHVPCSACGSAGQVPSAGGRCPSCQGAGRTRWARGHMVFSRTCAVCAGTGQVRFQRCQTCIGHGRTVRSEPVEVLVPPGTSDGARLRVPEKGNAGRHGGRPGDLYVSVNVQPHPVFRRDGDTLFCVVPVSIQEAALGARIEVPTLDGPVRLRVPPGAQGGQRFRLSGRGVAGAGGVRGDLVVEITLMLPPVLDERSKELIREFGRRNDGDVRRELWRAVDGAREGPPRF